MKEKKLTICFFGEADSIHTLKWAAFFLKNGHKVHLISYAQPGEYESKGINIHTIKKKFPIATWPINTILNLPLTVFKVRKIVKSINPDIIHAHCLTSYGTLASLIRFHPYVLTTWGSDILVNARRNLIERKIAKYVFSKADLITCDAEHIKKAMVDLGADSSKIKIINFGIDIYKFKPGSKDKKLKKSLGVLGYKIVISLRSLEPVYDVESLIKAASIILRGNPKIKFIIAGEGSQEEILKKMAKNLGISENINFIGRIKNEELPRYLRIADVYVSTSLSDAGISASTAEAMACGVPVVITDSGENKKWVKDGKEGFIVPVKNPEILAEKIKIILKKESKRLKLGNNARRVIEKKNSYYDEMKKMEELYKQLIIR